MIQTIRFTTDLFCKYRLKSKLFLIVIFSMQLVPNSSFAMTYLRSKKFMCEPVLEQLDTATESILVILNNAQVNMKKSEFRLAEYLADKVISRDPQNEQAWKIKMNAVYRQKKIVDAREIAEKVIRMDPQFKPAWAVLAKSLIKMKLYTEAQEAVESLASFDPSNPRMLGMRAEIAIGRGDFELANKFLEQLSVDPNNRYAIGMKVQSLLGMGKTHQAVKAIEEILATDPRDSIALAIGAKAYSAIGNYKRAMELLDQQLALNPKDHLAKTSKGQILTRTQEWEKALALGKELVMSHPRDIFVRALLIQSYIGLKDFRGALNDLKVALELDPKGKTTLGLAAGVYLGLNQPEKAAPYIEVLLSQNPRNEIARSLQISMFFKMGRVAESIALASAAAEEFPTNFVYQTQLVVLNIFANQNQIAWELIRKMSTPPSGATLAVAIKMKGTFQENRTVEKIITYLVSHSPLNKKYKQIAVAILDNAKIYNRGLHFELSKGFTASDFKKVQEYSEEAQRAPDQFIKEVLGIDFSMSQY